MQGQCNKCSTPDPEICPAISFVANTDTLLHYTPVPLVQIQTPRFLEIRAGTDLTVQADILVPDSRVCCSRSGCGDRPLNSQVSKMLSSTRQQYTTFAAGSKLASIQWSLAELAPLRRMYRSVEDQHHAAGLQQDFTVNAIDLTKVESTSALLKVPQRLLKPGHYYKLFAKVKMQNSVQTVLFQNGSDTSLIFVKNRVLTPILTIREDRPDGHIYVPLDNSFITIQGKSATGITFPVKISVLDTRGLSDLPSSATVTYLWDCRKWPAGELEYWRKDSDILAPDDRVVEKCFFNNSVDGMAFPQTQEQRDESFPCCNRPDFIVMSVELDDRYTFEFNITIFVRYATDPIQKSSDEFRGFRRITVRRQDSLSNDYLLYGRTIEVNLYQALEIAPFKIAPDETLVLYASIPEVSIALALESWDGKCEHPSRRGQPACRIELEEVAQGLDVKNSVVSESTTTINVIGIPDFMSFRIKPEMVAPGNRFVFRLSIKTLEISLLGDIWRERGYAEIMLEVNRSPRSGMLVMSPSNGKAFVTEFGVEASRFDDDTEDLPLYYAFGHSIGIGGERTFLSGSSPNPVAKVKLPMLQEQADAAPCILPDSIPGGPCAVFDVFVVVTDSHGAQTESREAVMVTLVAEEAITFRVLINTFDNFRRQAYLSKDYAAMANLLKQCSFLLNHPAMAAAVLVENTADPLSVQLAGFKAGLIDTLLDVTSFDGGAYLQVTPILASMIAQAINDAVDQQNQLSNEQFNKLFALTKKMTRTVESSKNDKQLLSTILDIATRLAGSSLVRFKISGVSKRRLLQSSIDQSDAVQNVFELLSSTIRSVCTSALIGASMDASGRVGFETKLFSVTCSKFSMRPLPDSTTKETVVPESTDCSQVEVSMDGWSSEVDADLATTVFKFNPVSFPGVKTADGLLDGQLQATYGIAWPLNTKACPVMIRHSVAGIEIPAPYSAVKIITNVPLEVARQTFVESQDPFVFRDTIFSATCQHWYASTAAAPGAWYSKNGTVDIKESAPSFVCNTTRWPQDSFDIPPPLASGKIECRFARIPDPASHSPTGLYGIITEPTDCAGTIDVPSRKLAGVDWPRGQFSFINSVFSARKACDRCKVCGGGIDCVLTCSSKRNSDETLDLCGVCGGICTFEAGCTPDACTQPYFRYLGGIFPNDYDVKADGRTAGKLVKGSLCPQIPGEDGFIDQPPARSPNGFCQSLDPEVYNGRIERYPYNSLEKICWENSPVIPQDSPDKLCQFQRASFFLDDPGGGVRKLKIQALDHNGLSTVGEKDVEDRIIRADPEGLLSFSDGTSSIEEEGISAAILSGINRLLYQPPLNFNSKCPPTRWRQLRFHVEGSEIPPTMIRMRIKPVNDPPVITASLTPYQIQEDRVTRIASPAVQIVDDAEDMMGHFINVTLKVFRTGSGIRTASSGAFGRSIAISGSLAFVNSDLRTLDYLGPENSNDDFDIKDTILVNVFDNGYGGEAPYNVPFSHSLLVNLTLVIQNDPPIALVEKQTVIFEGGKVKIKGAHVVDPDSFQHTNQLYEGSISVEEGMVSMDILKINCTVLSRKPYAYSIPTLWKYVDETMPMMDAVLAYSVSVLKVDGRVGFRKATYLNFEVDIKAMEDAIAYSGVKMVVALYKYDCYDAMQDNGLAGESGTTSIWSPGCVSSGSFPVSLVRCPVSSETQLFTYKNHESVSGVQVGMARFTARSAEWVYAALDSELVIEELGGSTQLCLRLDDVPAVNEVLRFIAPVTTSAGQQSSTEERLLPRLDISMGASINASFSPTPPQENEPMKTCLLEVRSGSSIDDAKFQTQAELDVLNRLVEVILYRIKGKYANRLGGGAANITFSVEDVSARDSCAAATGFGFQACNEINHANTSVLIIPIKEARTPLRMQPWYHDRWIRTKSTQGKLPVIVQLEDCGNRGWEEECPYRLQIVPDEVVGEYAVGRVTVEIASRLGTLTIPEDLRAPLTFEKGMGFRDTVVRVTGFAPDIRKAMMDIVYHSRLDKHLQYSNLYSEEFNSNNLACSRLCFINDIGAPAFVGEDEVAGCNKGCARKIHERVNKQLLRADEDGDTVFDEKGIFLDDVLITFADNGVTGVGLDKYTTVLLYNIYTIAVNDRPCIVFKGRISQGCRQDCAHPGLPHSCYDSGLPFDLNIPFTTVMYEGQKDPILIGGLVSKVVDEYEFSRVECRSQLDDTLANRGDDVVDPMWLVECPRLNIRVAAEQGSIALNSREYIEIFLGAEKTFISPIAFLGYPLDSNAAMRMIRYKLSEENPYFNRNQGTERVRLTVSDQGFSGSDPSGEFDGSASESTLEFVIDIIPVNNLPIITVPRESDPIEVNENVPTQMSRKALAPGLNVQDVDSDECVADGQGFGKLTLIASVLHGRIFINPVATSTLEALPGSSQGNLDFFVDPTCSDLECRTRLEEGSCLQRQQCAWNTRTFSCSCKLVRRPGKACSSLKIRGFSRDIQNAMRTLVYSPQPDTNYLNFPDVPELLRIRVSDKREPDDLSNTDVSCGETLGDLITWTEGSATLRTTPVNQPALVTIDPPMVNYGFEYPAVCEGNFDCEGMHVPNDGMAVCTGVGPRPVSNFGWDIKGTAGVSYFGWKGDMRSPEGVQHLYLSPGVGVDAIVNQTIPMLAIGARYKIVISLGARTTGNRGAAFRLTMTDRVDYPWATLYPRIDEPLVVSLPGKDSYEAETAEFIAHRAELPLQLAAYVDNRHSPASGRLVFVDNVRVQFMAYQMLEGTELQMQSVRIVDPDYVPGVIALMTKNAVPFHFKITIQAKYGVFTLKTDMCTVAPPNQFMNDVRRVAWGVRCWDFTGDITISRWANQTLFRPNCPPGWTGAGTQFQPCVNLPLKSFSSPFSTPYFSYFYPNGQTQIPTKEIELVGTKEGLEEVIQNRLLYVPEPYFNTDNLGKEVLTITSNDLANYNGDVRFPNIVVQNFVVEVRAVNNPPNISFFKADLEINEDFSVVLEGARISDPDVNELACTAEPCESQQGLLVMRAGVKNGSISISPSVSARDFAILRQEAFGSVFSKDSFLQECVMKLSCTERGGYLTLSSMTLVQFCVEFPGRCEKVTIYCTVAEMAARGRTNGDCLDKLNAVGLAGATLAEPSLIAAEFVLQEIVYSTLRVALLPVLMAKSNSILMIGSLNMINDILDANALTYTPGRYYNGQEICEFEVNDLGGKGIGYPCDPGPDVLPPLMFEYCSQKVPHAPLVTRRSFSIIVKPINNYPLLQMYDVLGINLLEILQPMDAMQNVTRILNRMEVIDVDILETPGCEMSVGIVSKSGGSLFFNITKAPKLDFTSNPTQTEIIAIGTLRDIQIYVSNVEYQSDAQFVGIENLIMTVKDNGCSGDDLTARSVDFETFVLQVVVSRPKVCRFATCESCVAALNEDCGWCPSSCKGKGKCKEALGQGLGPKVGDCPTYCVDGVCLTWNMCDVPPDTSWRIGVFGSPFLFLALINIYFLFMWARRHYGTIPLYLAKSGANVLRTMRNLSLSPQENSRMGQVVYLVCLVSIAALLPGIIQEIVRPKPIKYSLGEAATFKLQTDACNVLFVSDSSFNPTDSPKIETQISDNLQNVFVNTDFCAEDQFIEVNNTRLESVRYTGYVCEIVIRIPADPSHSIPPMEITNVGSRLTTIKSSDEARVVNFDPNVLTIKGTLIKIDLFNLRVRKFYVPMIQGGDIKIHNMTFSQIQIETDKADISISVSSIEGMFVPIDIKYRQSTNSICLVSADSPEYLLENTCLDLFRDVVTTTKSEDVIDGELVVTLTNSTKTVQDWTCTKDSKAVLIPYKRDLQPGLSNKDVQLRSNSGQIYFQSVPLDRVPPRSGRSVLDNLYVHDGLHGSRELQIEEEGAKILDVSFHPGGATRPKEEWLDLTLSGPSLPLGQFVWVADIRYLVVPSKILQVLSFGLLVPQRGLANVPLKPSLCPEFDAGSNPESQFLRPTSTRVEQVQLRNAHAKDLQSTSIGGHVMRQNPRRQWNGAGIGNSNYLVRFYRLLYHGVNGIEMPASSYIAFKPRNGPFVVFEIDPVTGKTMPKEVVLSDYPLIVALLAFGLLIPGIVATTMTLAILSKTRVAIKNFRQRKFNQELGARKLLDCLRPERPDDEGEENELIELKLLLYSKTNFFYFLDYQIGDPDAAASLPDQVFFTTIHILVIAISFVPLLLFAMNWQAARIAFECVSEPEPYVCGITWSVPEWIVMIFIIVHCSTSTFELYSHYANLKWSPWRKLLRLAWYTTQSLMFLGSVFYLCVVITWIFIGFFIKPSQFSPYVTAFAGGGLVLAKYWKRTSKSNERTANAIRTRAERLSERGYGELPVQAVVSILDKTLDKVLKQHKLTLPTLVNSMFVIFSLIAGILAFLFVGFHSLTDTTNIYVGSFNSVVTGIFMIAIDKAVNSKKDKEIQAQDMSIMVKEAISEGIKTIQFLTKQLDMGVLLMEAAKKVGLVEYSKQFVCKILSSIA